ncbi:MAG TPA: hypothetical protein VH518_09645, partial [Tepidisphaeraceae bacterium]
GLKRLDRTAPRRLAINQIAFGILLFSYGAFCLWTALHAPPDELVSDPQLRQMMGPFQDLARELYIIIYGSVMLAAVIGPGLTAFYYSRLTKHIDAYLSQTPQWILELQQAGMSV